MIGIFTLYLKDTVDGFSMSEADASDLYGTFIALVFLTPFVGGLLADRVLGYRRSITIGGLLMSKIALAPVTIASDLERNSQIGMVENLGQTLFSRFLVPFELVSVLFLSAMVGAVMLGRREKGEKNF